jgi:hypothetical protein
MILQITFVIFGILLLVAALFIRPILAILDYLLTWKFPDPNHVGDLPTSGEFSHFNMNKPGGLYKFLMAARDEKTGRFPKFYYGGWSIFGGQVGSRAITRFLNRSTLRALLTRFRDLRR